LKIIAIKVNSNILKEIHNWGAIFVLAFVLISVYRFFDKTLVLSNLCSKQTM